ncbi:alpha/beta fold hydrolase [Georgenia subflava]|uniref:Alpha/beta fold hydrolase n=1 Tax=Georgenia subflava TaxID=1622177 RepID=A0A6N7EMC9_9MICO|nr:alpha/beta hydrolase [Georgenia subflava]MPV36404.1 alpha/beta fold hydrolase [Georgenia subflava]
MSTLTYSQLDVAVDGGLLHAGVWEPAAVADDATVPTVLAVHGITATHQAWNFLPPALPGVRVVAPDLRGRGRSNALAGPYGMGRHADDLAALLRQTSAGPVVVVGHSMGGFASVVLAHRHPELVSALLLVDGGLPLDVPTDLDPDVVMQAVLGPAAERLSMTFPDPEAYRDFWRGHPAFVGQWSERLGTYFDYDLEAVDGVWRPSSRLPAVTGDQRELVTGESLLPALDGLSVPTHFLRAPRGLQDGDPLYAPEHVARWSQRLPSLTTADVPDVNHYTIVMSTAGAGAVAEKITNVLEGARR